MKDLQVKLTISSPSFTIFLLALRASLFYLKGLALGNFKDLQ